MRLDVYIAKNGLAAGRNRANELIKSGAVNVNGKTCLKPSHDVSETDTIEVGQDVYFSRGEQKLNAALDFFQISCLDKICVDIGASTGGFTYALLQHGAAEVYAVDVGHGQLRDSLRKDERVHVLEGYNARTLNEKDIGGKRDLFVIDVSFISITLVLPSVIRCLTEEGAVIALLKPQFEADGARLKNGVLHDRKKHFNILNKARSSVEALGCHIVSAMCSPVTGRDGNIEYFIFIKNGLGVCNIPENIVPENV